MTLNSDDKQKLDTLLDGLENEAKKFIGYPCNDAFDYSELTPFWKHSINNIGDPFIESSYRLNTHSIEREVIKFFAELFHLDDTESWGYVTHGGTEGNMYGMYLARELYPQGVVYYSEDTHYSVQKLLRLIGLRSIMIRAMPSGAMDIEDLSASLALHRDAPAIIFANIGTTMKGALDDIDSITDVIKKNRIRESYIHCDAALSGMILPFMEDAPIFDFRQPINSISVSGHKLIGAPFPCGLAMARKNIVNRIARSVEYVGSLDTTLAGSRNALAPVFLWYAIRSHGIEGFKSIINKCVDIAIYAEEGLNKLGLNAWRNPHSITVVFDRPPEIINQTWSVAVYGKIAHIITVPHVTYEMVDRLLTDIKDSINNSEKEPHE